MKYFLFISLIFFTNILNAQQDLSNILKEAFLSDEDFAKKINALLEDYSGETIAEEAVKTALSFEKEASATFFSKITDAKIVFSDKEKGYLFHEKGRFYYNNYEYEPALAAYKKAVNYRKKGWSETHASVGDSWYMASVCERSLGQLKEAMISLKSANAIYEFNKLDKDVVDCQALLGGILVEQSDYAGAMIYYETAVEQYKKNAEAAVELADVYWKMGEVSNKIKDYQKGEEYATKAYQIYHKTKNSKAFTVLEISAEALLGQKKYDAALLQYAKIEENLLKNPTKNVVDLIAIYQNISIVFKEQKNLDSAKEYVERAAKIIDTAKLSPKRKSNLFHNLGAIYLELSQPVKSLSYFQNALIFLLHNFKNKTPTTNPAWQDEPILENKTRILKTLDYKGQAFWKAYQQKNNPKHLEAAFQTYQSYSELITLLRSDFYQKGSKLFWLNETYPAFERALEVTYTLFEKTNNPTYAQAAFELMEKNKSVLLLEASQREEVEILAAIPDSLLQKKAMYNQALTDLERARLDLGNVAKTDSQLVELTKKINAKKIQLHELEAALRADFPVYEKHLAQRLRPDLTDFAQHNLSKSQALIEFFMGDTTIYRLGLTQNEYFFHQIPKNDLEEKINQFGALLKSPNGLVDEKQFAGLNHEISQQLLMPILTKIPPSIDELIIVPDGQLAYLPFDILLTESVDRPADLPYLLKKHAVGYANSATLFQAQKSDNQSFTSIQLIGFAPSFQGNQILADLRSCTADGLSPLVFNQAELDKITRHFSGETLSGTAASVDNFLANSCRARILHLATHACVDDQNAAQSRIYFTDDFLYAHELYQQQISAEMVVLSACETGVGTYAKGEGMMSLARGFSYAGIPSVTTSLWSVNDETTAELMGYFYEHLAKKQPKHIALQQAKLQYLNNQGRVERLAPFYWAGFVHYGQTTPIKTATSWWKWGLGFGILLIVGLFFIWKRRFA